MGTLSTELGTVAGRISGRPRIYADANVPAGLVSFMRTRLGWDVLFVIEHDDLRRARDDEHYRLARQLRRTLVTLDRDYLDERGFPSAEGSGVLVVWAPNENGLAKLLERVDTVLFHSAEGALRPDTPDLPLEGQKLQVHPDWMIPAGGERRRRR